MVFVCAVTVPHEIGVIGGGVAGLAAALALARAGFDVTVYEQGSAITEFGAGLQISPNGAAVLDHLGLTEGLDQAGIRAQAVSLIDGPSGRPVARFDVSQGVAGRGYYFLHRADMVSMLGTAAKDAGARLKLGQRVVAIEDPKPEARLIFENGASAAHPLVVVADGVHSVARAALDLGHKPSYSGQVAWRALVPMDGPLDPLVRVHMGPGRHLVHYPLAGGRLMNIVAVEERTEWAADGWSIPGDPAQLCAAFSGFALPVRDLLGGVEDVHLWGLHHYRVLEHWSKGPVLLIGDAAHPMLPFMAQGASLALEDAGVLARLLRGKSDISSALEHFENIRKNRVERIVAAARANGRNYHRRGLSKIAAHLALGLGQRLAPGLVTRRFDWIYAHDAVAQASSSTTTGT